MHTIRHCEFCPTLDEITEDAKLLQIRTADIVEQTMCWRMRQRIEETGEASCEGCEKPDCILNAHFL